MSFAKPTDEQIKAIKIAEKQTLGDPSKPIIVDLISQTTPDPQYVWGYQHFPDPSQIGTGFFNFMNPYDGRSDAVKRKEIQKEIDTHNKNVMLRGRILTLINKMGISFPPRVETAGAGGIDKVLKPVLKSSVKTFTEALSGSDDFLIFVNAIDPAPPPSMNGWTREQRAAYAVMPGPDGYAAYLAQGGTPILELSNALNLAAMRSDRFNLPEGNVGSVHEVKGSTIELINKPAKRISRMQLKNRATVLQQTLMAYLAAGRMGPYSGNPEASDKFLKTLRNALMTKVKSDPRRSTNMDRLLNLFRIYGIYVPTASETTDLGGTSGYAKELAGAIMKLPINKHFAVSLMNLLRQLVDELEDSDQKDILRDGLSNVPTMASIMPVEEPEQQFGLLGAIDEVVDNEEKEMVNLMLESGLSADETKSRMGSFRDVLVQSLGGEAAISQLSERDAIEAFSAFISTIESVIGKYASVLKNSEPAEIKPLENVIRQQLTEAIYAMFKRLTESSGITFQTSRSANSIAQTIVEWLMEGKNPITGKGGAPSPQRSQPSGSQPSGRPKPPAPTGPVPVATMPSLHGGVLPTQPRRPAVEDPMEESKKESKEQKAPGTGIPEESDFETSVFPFRPNRIPYLAEPGEVELTECKKLLDVDLIDESDFDELKSIALENLGTPEILEGSDDFRGDITLLTRSLFGGRVIIRTISPDEDPENPVYEVEIGGKTFRIKKRTLIWLLSMLLSLLAGYIIKGIDRAVDTLKDSDKFPRPPGKDVDPSEDPTRPSEDDKQSYIPRGSSVREHKKVGGEAYVLGATDREISHNEKLFRDFQRRPRRGGIISEYDRKLYGIRFRGLQEPKRYYPKETVPRGNPRDLPHMRNIYQFDDFLDDVQTDMYSSWTRVMPNERHLSAFENENSIYHDNAYDKQIRNPRRPLVMGEYQQRRDGLDQAPFSYATYGLRNTGQNYHSGQVELYPNMYEFPQPKTERAAVYKASRKYTGPNRI